MPQEHVREVTGAPVSCRLAREPGTRRRPVLCGFGAYVPGSLSVQGGRRAARISHQIVGAVRSGHTNGRSVFRVASSNACVRRAGSRSWLVVSSLGMCGCFTAQSFASCSVESALVSQSVRYSERKPCARDRRVATALLGADWPCEGEREHQRARAKETRGTIEFQCCRSSACVAARAAYPDCFMGTEGPHYRRLAFTPCCLLACLFSRLCLCAGIVAGRAQERVGAIRTRL